MPRFRADLAEIAPHRAGTPIDEVRRRSGLDRIARLALNEGPVPPFPAVQEAVAAALGDLHRYPDDRQQELRDAVAAHLGVAPGALWFGSGSSELLLAAAVALGGPAASIVFAWPSFGLYRIASQVAGATPIEVPLRPDHRHDLEGMLAAIRPDTTLVYVCNPNNPTGTHVAADALSDFVAAMPEQVAVVVDEAYVEYATAADHGSALPLVAGRDNVLVAHTFSKVYGLAGLRCGYMVGAPETIQQLRRVQLPFTVNHLAQVAATEALRHQDLVAERVEANAAGLKRYAEELAARDIECAESQANFVYFRAPVPGLAAALRTRGVAVRQVGTGVWQRVSIGTDAENRKFFRALDECL